MNEALVEIRNRLDTLEKRMDRFFEWAGELQKQHRNSNNRITFIESQCLNLADFHPSQSLTDDRDLLKRLDTIKAGKRSPRPADTGPQGVCFFPLPS